MESQFDRIIMEAYDEAECELMMESLDELIYEMQKKRPFPQYKSDVEKSLKLQIKKYGDLMKKYPEKADFYKAQLDVVNLKGLLLKAKEKVEAIRNKK